MAIEQVERSYFWPLIKDRRKKLKPGDKGPFKLFGGVEVISDDTLHVKGNKRLLIPEKTLKGDQLNQSIFGRRFSGDPLHFLPPRNISYRYKPSDKK